MKLRLFALFLIAAALLALVAACGGGGGGDGGLTLEEYFQQLDAIADDADKRFEALNRDLFPEEGFDSEEEEVEANRASVDGAIAIDRDILDALNGIDPPPQAELAHDEFVAAVSQLLEVIRNVSDQLEDVDSASELDEVFVASGIEAAGDRSEQACFALQDVAVANGIDVDLTCGD